MILRAILLLLLAGSTAPQLVTNLPGFEGDLPFTLETGYIGVGEANESQLFYYFVESEGSLDDPLVLWFDGGPGCSCLIAFFYESGPLIFKYGNYSGGLPKLYKNPNAWTKFASIIYLDTPVGTGFSYSTTQENYYTDDYRASQQVYEFLRKWLIEHPRFLGNEFYLGGDSYAGTTIPIILQDILDGNKAGNQPFVNLKGYVLGNPRTNIVTHTNSRVIQAHRLTLISDEIYETAKISCNGKYVNINASNVECVTIVKEIHELLLDIFPENILQPYCKSASPKTDRELQSQGRRYMEEDVFLEDSLQELNPPHWCRNYLHVLSHIWANDEAVREAIHVRANTKGEWTRCNDTVTDIYKSVTSVVDYHRNFSTQTNLRALIYSGDHDLFIPHIGTLYWIGLLNLTLYDPLRPWFVGGQVAGYTKMLENGEYYLTYATVKGAGHVAPEYYPKQCSEMMDRFLAYYPL